MTERDRSPEAQYSFDQTHSVADARRNAVAAIHEGESANLGGRLVGMRDHGHYVFGDVRDQTGEIQFIAEEGVTPALDELRASNPGDWLGLEGHLGKSKRGAPSLFVKDWVMLARTDTPFPYKQGLEDQEIRSRQRYLDLGVNADSLRRFQARSTIIHSLRGQLTSQDFVEVETPTLQTLYGGAAARPFETHMNSLDLDLYMRIAPELFLKRCVVGGLERVFEIGKVFRNEGLSPRHNPEFTMMEVYAAYWDGEKQMQLTETVVSSAARLIHGGETVIDYQGERVNLTPPWPRVPMDKLVSDAIGEEVSVDTDISRLRELCERHDIPVEAIYGTGKLLLELYEKTVEKNLRGPIFVTDYPKEVSPLARSHRSRPGYAERFEGIVAGGEICNGFTELNDPREQFERFIEQEATKEVDDEAMRLDHDYVRALQHGLPPTAGLGIGIDRLVMLLTDAASIRDVVLFPTMRPDDYRVTDYEER